MKIRSVALLLYVVSCLLVLPLLVGCDLGTYERRLAEDPASNSNFVDSSDTESQ